MRRLLTAFTLSLAATAAGAAGAAPALAACERGSKSAEAKVQLWKDPGCGGGSKSVGRTGEDDRPDFNRFPAVEGGVHDISNSRSSVGIAEDFCVRFFDFMNYRGDVSGLYCAGGPGPSYHELRNFNDRATSMRTCPILQRALCNAKPPATTTEPPTGPGEGDVPPEPELNDPAFDQPPPEPDPFSDPSAPMEPSFEDGSGELGPLGPNDGLRFDRASRKCSGRSLRGARALRVWLAETGIATRGEPTLYRCAKRKSRRDLHANGRAVDVQPASTDAGRELVALLLEDDYALIRRMGIQEIIHDGMVWSSARPTRTLRRYRGRSPHRRSVHIGLNRRGAAMATSFWKGR